MWKVPLFDLNYDERESKAVQAVLDSKWLTMGQNTATFERQFSQMLETDEDSSVFVSNCTMALFASLLALDLKEGDEVIIPALTFVADINAVLMAGGMPVLADCESMQEWNITAETIQKQLTPKTKAVIIVHFAGFPCKMEEIVTLCKEKKIILIEDVAHAPAASYKGKKCGTFGTFGCFSFFTNKNLSLGEGGMVVVSNSDFLTKIKHLRSHGMSSLTLDRHKGRAISYDVLRPGLNFRSDEIHAALGLTQLEKLTESNKKREELTLYYRKQLAGIDGVSVPFALSKDIVSSYHIFPILLADTVDRFKVIETLKTDGVQSSIHYPAMQSFSGYSKYNLNDSPIAEHIAEHELTLPLFPTMTFDQVDRVVDSLKGALKS